MPNAETTRFAFSFNFAGIDTDELRATVEQVKDHIALAKFAIVNGLAPLDDDVAELGAWVLQADAVLAERNTERMRAWSIEGVEKARTKIRGLHAKTDPSAQRWSA